MKLQNTPVFIANRTFTINMMAKKGLGFELVALEFLERIFSELGYEVTRKRNQNTGTQDGYDNLIEIVTDKYKHHTIYAECKDYSSNLSYTQAIEKIPHIVSTHKKIDLLLFISPFEDFKNPNEPAKMQGFYDIISEHCPVQFLTPEYHIKEYFRMYPDLFKTVYNEDSEQLTGEKRRELLNKFDKLIFSSENLYKIIVQEEDKGNYIGLINYLPYHISRTFRTNPQRDPYFWNSPDYIVEFNKLISDCSHGITVLGNPGSGKTTELKYIALSLWNSREENDIIPFYASLKNFNSASTISNILPKEYNRISYLLVILDGLDEVYDITDFSNKLRTFIDEQKTVATTNTLKFIISCRTTIYNKIIKDLEGFASVYLNPVGEGQALHYLEERFGIDFHFKHSNFDLWRNRDLLESPFYLELIGKNYLTNGEIEISRSKLVAQYIASRLEEDEQEKFRNDEYSSGLHLKQAKKVAFAMETMQLSAIDDTKAIAFLGETKNLSKNPFIEQSIDRKWSFELKNIQEYLVADMLSKMEIDQLLSLIRIDDDINKVHPSWLNVVTFLANMEFEQKETYQQLVDWLVVNDVEIIFQSDAELISDKIRNKTLQSYFQTQCIDKTLWINNEVAVGNFGDTSSNIEYLFEKALDRSLNVRTRLSAIVLLDNMSLMNVENSERVKILLEQLMDEFNHNREEHLQMLARTLHLIPKTTEEIKPSLLQSAINFVSIFDYREFVQIILPLITPQNFQYHQEFVLEILKKALKEIHWRCRSKYSSTISTKEQIFNIFNQITDTDVLISLFEFITQRLTNYELREKYVEQFIQHCSTVLCPSDKESKEKLVEIIFDVVTTNKIYHMEENLLTSLARDCSIDEQLFKQLLTIEDEKNSNIYFIEQILKKEWYGEIVDSYTRKVLPEKFIVNLRNRMQYDRMDDAIMFQTYIEKNSSYKFADRIEDSTFIEQRAFQQNSVQREFDSMFDITLLKTQMENIFHYYHATALSYEDVDKFWDKYYDDFELQKNVSEYAKRFLWQILRDKYSNDNLKLKIYELENVIINNELDRLEDIYQTLPKEDNSSPVVQDAQKAELEKWVVDNRSLVENYLDAPSDVGTSESKRLTLFLNVVRYFKFSGLEEAFLLKLIEFVRYTYFDFHFIEDMIGCEKVVEKVLTELEVAINPQKKIPLLSYLKSKSVLFNLDKFGIADEVLESIIKKNYDYAWDVIKLFYADNPSFLKSVAGLYLEKDEDEYLLIYIMNCLVEQGEYDFICDYVTSNYELLISKKLLEESVAIKYLIKSNGKLAFKQLKTIIMNTTANAGDTYHEAEYKSYTNTESIADLLDIARHCLSLRNYEEIFNGWFKPIRMVSDVLVSIGKSNDLSTSELILEGIMTINPVEDEKQNNRFYYESLVNDIKDVVYKHKSKPFSMKQAIACNKEYEYLFY